jgi:hypothetical protein
MGQLYPVVYSAKNRQLEFRPARMTELSGCVLADLGAQQPFDVTDIQGASAR